MSETDINATVNVTEDIYADVDSTAMSAAVIDDGDSIVVPAEVDFGHTLDTELEDNDLIDVPVDESVGIAGDHRVLLHRDAPNQHPMGAITGLNDALAGINTALSSRISQVEAETAELDVDMADALLRIGDLQNQVDGNITTWFYAAEPAMNLPPVAYDPSNPHDTGWDTDDKKNEHKGDLYYNTLTGYAYRFAYSDGAYGWLRITDTDVVKALADAAKAQDTADSKRRVFYTTPYPPYDKGDLWVQGGSGDILVCSAEKPADGSYDFADWSLASKYTDDTVADIALASANGKNTVYHQASQPTGGTYKKGDTWFDTDDDYTMYTYDGSLWVKEQFGNEAIADLSISNAKIKDATIEYGKIKSVDAGKITVGDISADRMKVNSISAINSNTGSVQISASKVDIAGAAVFNNYSTTAQMNSAIGDAVDGIEVGGRNYATLASRFGQENITNGGTTKVLADSSIVANGTFTATTLVLNTTILIGVQLEAGTYQLWATNPNFCHFRLGTTTSGTYWKEGDYTKGSPCEITVSTSQYITIGMSVSAGTYSNEATRIMFEKGTMVTDWTPAPEDVQAGINAKKSVWTLNTSYSYSYANILRYSAEGYQGTWTIDITTTPIVDVKAGDTVRLKVEISDMGSVGNRPSAYVIGTVVTKGADGLGVHSHGLDTTIIDGGNILTNSIGANQIKANSITADKIRIGDFNNYVTVTENDASSIAFEPALEISNGWLHKKNDAGNCWLSPILNNWTTAGEVYRITGKVKTPAAGRVYISICGRDSSGTSQATASHTTVWTEANTETSFTDCTITITDGIAEQPQSNIFVYFYSGSSGSTTQQGYLKDVKVERMAGGELIVDGAISARSLTAGLKNDVNSNRRNYARILSRVGASSTNYGVTSSVASDYAVCANGTATTNVYALATSILIDVTLEAGTYLFWATNPDFCYMRIGYGASSSWRAEGNFSKSSPYKETLTSATRMTVGLLNRSGVTYNNAKTYVMIEKGDTPSDWIPAFEDTDAGNYITHISDAGITVHPSGTTNDRIEVNANGFNVYKANTMRVSVDANTIRLRSPNGGFPQVAVDANEAWFAQDANSYATLNSSGFNIVKGGTSVAFYGDTARVGLASGKRFEIKSDGAYIYNGTTQLGYYGSFTRIGDYNGKNVRMDSDGVKVNSSQDNTIAVFGDTARIGKESGYHVKVGSNAITQQLNNSTVLYKLYGDSNHCWLEFLPAYNPDPSSYGTHIEANGSQLYLDSLGASEGYVRMSASANSVSNTTPKLECGQGGTYSTGKVQSSHTINVISDRRLKEHLRYLGDDAIEFVKKLKPAYFKIYDDYHIGFYAQDVEDADKWHALVSDTDGIKSLAYSELIAPLVTYCQHLEKRIEELERSNNGNDSN